MPVRWIPKILAAMLIFFACRANAQELDIEILQDVDLGNATGTESSDGVYVHDSTVAIEKMAHAQRMETRQWNTAAELYQEVIEKYADRLIPSQKDADGKVLTYVGVVDTVQRRLARWPADGLDVYRRLYEPAAEQLLASGDSIELLHRVVSRYFVTEAGKRGALRLLDLYLEDAQFAAAVWVGKSMLDWHPNLTVERPAVLFRVALAEHLLGNSAAATQHLEEIREKYPQARAVVRGKDVVIADALAAELESPKSPSAVTHSDSWPTYGGSLDRSRISGATGRPGAKIGFIEFAPPPVNAERAAAVRERRGLGEEIEGRQFNTEDAIGVFPVVDNGELFFQDGVRIYAVSVESTLPLPGWSETYTSQNGQYVGEDVSPAPRTLPLGVTLTGRDVLAVLGAGSRTLLQQGMIARIESTSKLVCLDRSTGRLRWSVWPKKLADAPASVRELDLVGTPLVVGDAIFVLGRGGKGQFEDCFALCFSLADGKFRWACHVASANTGLVLDESLGNAEAVPQISYSGGRLFVQSNLGAIAGIDAFSGSVVWLRLYPRSPLRVGTFIPRGRGIRPMDPMQPSKPWRLSPPIIVDGRLFALPADSDAVLVLDSGNGDEIRRLLCDKDLMGADTLLAVEGPNVLVAGTAPRAENRQEFQGTLMSVNWQNYNPRTFNKLDSTYVTWPKTFGSALAGRAFVTSDVIFVPLAQRLSLVDARKGRTLAEFPSQPKAWAADEGRGNVLVTQDHVVVATARGVYVYTDLSVARAKLASAEANDPTNPIPRLRHAEVMFAAAQMNPGVVKLDEVIAKLDEAIALLGGPESLTPGEARDKLFHASLKFAREAAKETGDEPTAAAIAFFDRARRAAGSGAQRVHWVLHRAKFDANRGQPVEAVRLYQSILDDPKLRTVPTSEASWSSTQAAQVAENEIEELIRIRGREIYKEFDAAADAAAATALNAEEPATLVEVAVRYPNATAAMRAMLAAADAYESAGRNRDAAMILRQAFFKHPDAPQRVTLLESMARNDLTLPGRLDAAVARLVQASRLQPGAKLSRSLKLPDGRVLENVTFAWAADELRNHLGQLANLKLPTFRLPSPEAVEAFRKANANNHPPAFAPIDPAQQIRGVDQLLVPEDAWRRHDRIVTWSNATGLSVFKVGDAAPLASTRERSEPPAQCAWIRDRLLVWGGSEITLFSATADALSVAWHFRTTELPAVDVVPEDPKDVGAVELVGAGERVIVQAPAPAPVEVASPKNEVIAAVICLEDRLIVATTAGRVMTIELETGLAKWQMRPSPQAPARMVATDDFVAMKLDDERGVRLLVVDSYRCLTRFARDFPPDPRSQPVNIALSADGTLVYTLPNTLCGQDLYDPLELRRFEVGVRGEGPPFAAATEPGHLMISEGRILAMSENGKFVRLHSTEDGKPLRLRTSGREVDARLGTGALAWEGTAMHPAGARLYVVGQRSLRAINLAQAVEEWPRSGLDDAFVTQHLAIGTDYVVAVDSLSGQRVVDGRAAKTYRLNVYSRKLLMSEDGTTTESGARQFCPEVVEPSGISKFQGVDGGFYYLTGDKRLVFLKGAGSE